MGQQQIHPHSIAKAYVERPMWQADIIRNARLNYTEMTSIYRRATQGFLFNANVRVAIIACFLPVSEM